MKIDVFHDTVCPWCWIGEKNLWEAIRQSGEEVTVQYRTFYLDPTIPTEGKPFQEVMLSKMGNQKQLAEVLTRVTSVGEGVGITFRFDQVEKMPNTKLSHQLIAGVSHVDQQKGLELSEAIMKAYFSEGQDIGQEDVLLRIAQKFGFSYAQGKDLMYSVQANAQLVEDLQYAKEIQVTGVPFFVIDQKLGLSGAHPPENFLRAFAEAKTINE